MLKKRFKSKKAQITVFMIIGLLILFIFIFLINFSSKLTQGDLKDIQEKTLTKAFKKEALRIFVEDCLTDELERGLLLIGKQGRLWSDQPGGTKNFEEGLTGITYNPSEDGGRVFYGITKEEYLEEENAYPCDNETNKPEFCRYEFPDTKVGYGKLELKSSTLQNDIRRFLINRSTFCVENFTKSNISSRLQLETEDIDLKLNILTDGIDVRVTYPLKLKLGDEEFFHLSKFDFFYPTRFKSLLEAAVLFPLRMDWKYLDFNYSKGTMESPYFVHGNEVTTRDCAPFKDYFFCNLTLRSDQYASLGIEMTKETLPDGDDLFVFEPALYKVINSPEKFVYRFVRENKPPALDYVKRKECPLAGYDYLVIENDETQMGIINITLSAIDPDEDKIDYSFGGDFSAGGKDLVVKPSPARGLYNVEALSVDEHGLKDWQDVRVLVDREVTIGLSLNMSYQYLEEGGSYIKYEDKFSSDVYFISNEDPVFVKVTFPEESDADLSSTQMLLAYFNQEGTESFNITLPSAGSNTNDCFSFPWLVSTNCERDDYYTTLSGKDLIDVWKDNLLNPAYINSELNKIPDFSHFIEETNEGILNISFKTDYCAIFEDADSSDVTVIVRNCTPHKNPNHPFAYPYEKYFYNNYDFIANTGDYSGNSNVPINPFQATHSCCVGVTSNPGDWKVAEEGTTCFRNPEPGCYGRISEWTVLLYGAPNFGGHVLEQEVGTCDGERGNACLGSNDYDLWNGKLVCGNNELPGCFEIVNGCENKPAWSYIDLDEDGKDDGWCNGLMGCTNTCQGQAVVYTGPESSPIFTSSAINSIASTKKPIKSGDATDFDFHCGCDPAETSACDSNYDGKFNGVCEGGTNECIGDS